jgi:hypothetical protein
MGGFDPGLDKLQALCNTLEGTNQVLDQAAHDLDARGKGLDQAEDELRDALDHLRTEADGLEKEVAGLDTQAVQSAGELGAAARQALDTWMPELETKVTEARAHAHEALTHHASSLQSEFDELESRGFDALDTVLTTEESEFQRWTGEAEAALKAQVEELQTADTDAKGDIQRAFSALTTADLVIASERGTAENTITAQMEAFDKDEPQEIEKRAETVRTSAVESIEEARKSVEAVAAAAHTVAEGTGTEGGDAIEKENGQLTEAVDQAGTACAEALTEFEQAGADAGSLKAEATFVAELRPGIEKADGEVTEIRELMEAVQ